MSKVNWPPLVIALLVGITLFSALNYIALLFEKEALQRSLDVAINKVSSLGEEKQGLEQEVIKEKEAYKALGDETAKLQESLKSSGDTIAQLNQTIAQHLQTIDGLNARVSSLQEEKVALQNERDNMRAQLRDVSQDRDALNAKFNSLDELKKAIRDVKQRLRSAYAATKKYVQRPQEKVTIEKYVEGNRGYLIKDGKPTTTTKVVIEVSPISQKP
jgi:chromosome segregation ATPase